MKGNVKHFADDKHIKNRRLSSRSVRVHTTWAQMPQAASPQFDSRLAGPFAACHSPTLFPYISCLSPLSLSNKGIKYLKNDLQK